MRITKVFSRLISGIFKDAIVDGPFDGCIWIRTTQWMISPEQMKYLRNLDLVIDSILTEGQNITIIIDKKTSKKALIS